MSEALRGTLRRPASVLLCALLLLGVLASPAPAASEAARAWKKAHRDVTKRERAYWKTFQDRLTAIYQEWTGLRRYWYSDPDAFKDEVLPLEKLRQLYADFAEIQTAAAAIDRSLAVSGASDAAEVLFDALMDVAKEIDRSEDALADANPVGRDSRYEQEPSVLRHGQQVRLEGLVDALAAVPGVVPFLSGEAFEKATKADDDDSTIRTAAVVDALGRTDDVAGIAFLGSEEVRKDPRPYVRIAVLQNIVRASDAAFGLVEGVWADPAPPVRRAFLRALVGTEHYEMLPALVARLPAVQGLEREFLCQALASLSGANHGGDEAAWQAWLQAHLPEIRDASFERKPPEGEGDSTEAKADADEGETEKDGEPEATAPAAPRPLCVEPVLTFYGLPAPSSRALFVLEGSSNLTLPADYTMQVERSKHHWRTTGPKWHETAIDHRDLLLEQLERTLEAAPEDGRFAVVHLFGATPKRVGVYGDRRRITPKRSSVRSLLKDIAKPNPAGQLSVEEGLRRAFDIAGVDPHENPDEDDLEDALEVLYVVDAGWQGGRWPLPELVVAAFARENRFRQLAVYAIRIADEKHEAAAMMQGLADVSGGACLWLTKLPPP